MSRLLHPGQLLSGENQKDRVRDDAESDGALCKITRRLGAELPSESRNYGVTVIEDVRLPTPEHAPPFCS